MHPLLLCRTPRGNLCGNPAVTGCYDWSSVSRLGKGFAKFLHRDSLPTLSPSPPHIVIHHRTVASARAFGRQTIHNPQRTLFFGLRIHAVYTYTVLHCCSGSSCAFAPPQASGPPARVLPAERQQAALAPTTPKASSRFRLGGHHGPDHSICTSSCTAVTAS